MISRLAVVLAILSPAFVSAGIPPLGTPRAVQEPGPGRAAGFQSEPHLASSGAETLVVWVDGTLGRGGGYVAELAGDGRPVEGTQRRLAGGLDVGAIRITWTGQSYLVIWSAGQTVVAMTMDGQRRTLTPPREVLQRGVISSDIAWIGERGAFLDSRNLVLIDRQGNVLRSAIDVSPGKMFVGGHLSTDGRSFFVFWNTWDELHTGPVLVRRYAADGVARDDMPVIVAASLQGIREDWDVDFGGNRFAVVAAEHQGGRDDRTLRPFLLHPDTLLTTSLPALPMGSASGTGVEWAGDRFVALWFHRNDFGSVSMSTLAFSEGGADAPVSRPMVHGYEMSELWNGAKLIVAFTSHEEAGPRESVHATAVDWRHALHEGHFAIARSPSWQGMAAVATTGQQSLVVWTEGVSWPLRVVAAHMTAGVVDAPAVPLTENALPVRPVVVATGSVYIVLWLEGDDFSPLPAVMMRRLSTSGAVLDPESIALSRGTSAAAAWNGTHVLVCWSSPDRVFAARLSKDGTPFDATASTLTSAGNIGSQVTATSNGSDFFVVWSAGFDNAYPSPDLIDLYGARVDATGTPGPAIPIAIGPANQTLPVVASDRRDYLVAYAEDGHLVTKKILREGVLAGTTASDPGRMLDPAPATRMATIAATGDGYVVAWEAAVDDLESTTFLAALDGDGSAGDPPTIIATSALFGMSPVLSTTGGRTGDFVYGMLMDDDAYGGTMRLFSRRIGQSSSRGRAVRH